MTTEQADRLAKALENYAWAVEEVTEFENAAPIGELVDEELSEEETAEELDRLLRQRDAFRQLVLDTVDSFLITPAKKAKKQPRLIVEPTDLVGKVKKRKKAVASRKKLIKGKKK